MLKSFENISLTTGKKPEGQAAVDIKAQRLTFLSDFFKLWAHFMQTSQYKWVFWAWRSDTWPWEHMPVQSPSLLWLLICLFIIVNKMYMQETSCLHLDLQLLCKDLIEKEKNPEGFFISFQHKQSSAKSEAQMHQNDEKSLYIRKWLCISSPDWGRNKQGGKHWKARGIRVFPDNVHYEGQSASALADTEKHTQPA